jgi:hypothetical protein
MSLLSHHHLFVLDDNVFTHYRCTICNFKRQLKPSKTKLLQRVANEQPDKFDGRPVSEKTLLKILEEGHSNIGSRPPQHSAPQPEMCAYCGKLAFVTKDHIYPKALIKQARADGKKVKGCGIVKVCKTCNGQKGKQLITEWLAKLQRDCDPRARYVEKVAERSVLRFPLCVPNQVPT